jgi:hypothetical protein
MLLDTPAGGLAALGVDPTTMSFGAVAARAGSRQVVAPNVLLADDAAKRWQGAMGDVAPAYRLDVTPHVIDRDHVRVDVDLELAGKQAKTTVIVADKQAVVLGTEVVIDDRRFVLLLRPTIVRSAADLEGIQKAKADASLSGG